MKGPNNPGRRRFITVAATAAAAVPLASLLRALPAHADDMPKLSEDDAQAKALGYKHDASAVDTTKFAKRAGDAGATQFCDNCQLYQGGDAEWGPCSIFPGRAVAAKGWCNAWVLKQG